MDKQIIKQLAERYKEICRSPFADGYTFTAFDGECTKKGFTRDDIKNYIEKEKQERKAKRTESIKSLKEQLKLKEQECERLKLDLIEARAHGDYLNNLALSKTLDTVSGELEQFKAGIDELKKQTCDFRPELKYIIDKTCCKYNINAKYYHEKIAEIINNLDKYKQTLIEIKGIAEKYKNLSFGEQQYCYSGILQKISECEVENER